MLSAIEEKIVSMKDEITLQLNRPTGPASADIIFRESLK